VGANALFLANTAGNHVIRYNAIYSTNGNYFFDGIGGRDDDGPLGAPGRDSDVYGNLITNLWDDAIEAEGGGKNVRIWGNFVDQAFVAFGLASVDLGPVYVFRNVVHRTQRSPEATDNSGVFIKNKTKPKSGGGRVYVFHNTVYRKDGSGGVRVGISATGTPLTNFVSRNNVIAAARRAYASSTPASSPANDLDYDLYTGTLKKLPGQQPNGIVGEASYGPFSLPQPFVLLQGSLGLDAGVPIPNFNDYAVGAPDMGAQERGGAPLRFGNRDR
jgi:hypothetical protein